MSRARAIHTYVVPWSRLDWPADWSRVFGNQRDLAVELGFGNGEFLEAAALEDPDRNWVAVEISWGSVKRLLNRLRDRGIDNVRILHGDGATVLERLFAPGTVREIVINNSDPWPKKRHHRRRLVQASFLATVREKLVSGGRVVIVTDHGGYAEWIEDLLGREPGLRSLFPAPWVPSLPGHRSTKYKRKGIEAGSTIRHFVWHKVGGSPPGAAVSEVPDMPNILLDGDCEFGGLLSGFQARSWTTEHQGDRVLLRLGAAYLRGDGAEWLVEAQSREGAFEQHFALVAAARNDGRVLLKLSSIGLPRPTWGVKKTLEALAALVLERNPGLRVHEGPQPSS
jgi:tRNA (guanine-N7-)-methyltransferase